MYVFGLLVYKYWIGSQYVKNNEVKYKEIKMNVHDTTRHIAMDGGVHATPATTAVETTQVKKRVVTTLDSWKFSQIDLQPDNQLSYIIQLYTNNVTSQQPCKVIMQHIAQKLSGYKSQDIKKGFYEPTRIADLPFVVDLLKKSSNSCYYCRESIQVLYENVREPKQWSLDRIFNDQGHNKENVVIACLKCNVSRKTMYHERYAFTKQLVVVKQN
jgi:hypothetical protein